LLEEIEASRIFNSQHLKVEKLSATFTPQGRFVELISLEADSAPRPLWGWKD
jgi:hypothetical protein